MLYATFYNVKLQTCGQTYDRSLHYTTSSPCVSLKPKQAYKPLQLHVNSLLCRQICRKGTLLMYCLTAHLLHILLLCTLMDFPIHINALGM